MGSYGLPGWIRVSVGTMPQNRAFMEALRELDREGVVGRDVLAAAS
jgi:histidinol-phosphate/aromatic aminotransferase/cobyric acid decarboxylase-like protein